MPEQIWADMRFVSLYSATVVEMPCLGGSRSIFGYAVEQGTAGTGKHRKKNRHRDLYRSEDTGYDGNSACML